MLGDSRPFADWHTTQKCDTALVAGISGKLPERPLYTSRGREYLNSGGPVSRHGPGATAGLMAGPPEAVGMTLENLPAGWAVWSDEATKVVLAYRPDVFDTAEFPPPCLPTIYITKGRRNRRPGRNDPDPGDPWYVRLFLEPEVERPAEEYESRAAAVAGAADLAEAFARGGIDYRDLYQVPRPEYFERLDELTGREG